MDDHGPNVRDSDTHNEIARDRIVRLFQYVAEYHQMRNPAVRQASSYDWTLALGDIPEHPSIVLVARVYSDNDSPQEENVEEAPAERILLRSTRPKLTEPPPAPEVLEGWLGRDWQDCRGIPKPVPSKNQKNPDTGETLVIAFADDDARVKALVAYQTLWDGWATAERVALKAGAVFESLYDLQGRLRRDGERYELILADGWLTWARDDGEIRHPILFRSVRLDFEATIPEFRVIETSEATEFYSSLFRGMPDVSGELVGVLRSDVEKINPHPLGTSETDAFLTSVASTLSSRGTFIGTAAAGAKSLYPVISRAPLFLVRQRTMGMARAIDLIVKNALEGGDLAASLCSIVGFVEEDEEVPGLAASGKPESAGGGVLEGDLLDENILFTKPANAEQLEIARRLERESCVTVQGPPGTGKSHTIANLIGHLLATGKRVLVTSHTTKALRVLRDKVVEELQPLCLSVLDSAEDDAALKSSIDGIVQRLGSADARHLERDIANFTAERKDLILEIRRLEAALRDSRLGEQLAIVLEGASIAPIAAAKEIASGKGIHDCAR